MTLEEVKLIEDNTDFVKSTTDSYSGRCMFGETTHGIIVDRYDVDETLAFCKQNGICHRLDNMGFDYIIY